MKLAEWWIIILAFVLDLIFKDIELWPHPVRAIGWILNELERIGRTQGVVSLRIWGALSLFFVCMGVGSVIYWMIGLPVLGILFKVYFSYAGLSLGGLLEKGREIVDPLREGRIEEARERLQYIVSRDTSGMDEVQISTSLAETLSENFNDGFVAPLFYLLLGGPVFLWIYKAVSTMDSMWGYRTPRWRDIGWAGAKMDDVFGYLPARISFFMIFLGRCVEKRSTTPLSYVGPALVDASSMESPNAGWPMAAVAWCFSSTMGGRWRYFGEEKIKPYLGPTSPIIPWSIDRVEKLIRFLLCCGVMTVLFFCSSVVLFRSNRLL